MSACGKSGQWQQALWLLIESRKAMVKADTISYGAGISACEKCGKWRQGLSLLGELRQAKLKADVVCTVMSG